MAKVAKTSGKKAPSVLTGLFSFSRFKLFFDLGRETKSLLKWAKKQEVLQTEVARLLRENINGTDPETAAENSRKVDQLLKELRKNSSS